MHAFISLFITKCDLVSTKTILAKALLKYNGQQWIINHIFKTCKNNSEKIPVY